MAALDVVGYNYVDARYELDHRLFPNRVLVGSETFPPAIDRYWKLVREMDHVIGDFTWTGWDYLGEVGVGRTDYSEGQTSLIAPYPWLTAWCGDIDITGARRPISYYREIVFGLRSDPYIAVQLPEHHGKKPSYQKWSWTDSIASWSWEGYEGRPVVVEVYADADEVELLLGGVSLGRRPAGEANRFRAEFETTYEPGELVAVAYRGGQAVGRHSLRSASGPVRLDLRADRDVLRADDSDLAFVEIELVDADGTVFTNADRAVAVSVTGPAHLQALGSANPRNEESFGEFYHTTFKGRVLAVVRPAGQGEIVVSASAEGCDAKSVKLTAH
jgi:beta-galactosidase